MRAASGAAGFVLAAALASGAAAADCLVAWRSAAGTGAPRVACRDGDPACDLDGVADGGCTFGVAVCLDLAGCLGGVPSVRVRGPGADAVMDAVAALGTPAAAPDHC